MSNDIAQRRVLTPPGRLLWMSQSGTNMKGQPLVFKDGTPRTEYSFGLAVPKDLPLLNEFFRRIETVAAAVPQERDRRTNELIPYNLKFIDGDSDATSEKSDVPYYKREGYPGHLVFRINGSMAVDELERDNKPVLSDAPINPGDYVDMLIDIAPNFDRPGVYLNPRALRRLGHGPRLGANNADIMGAAPAMPAGASATPVASVAPNPSFLNGNGVTSQPPAAPAPAMTMPPPPAAPDTVTYNGAQYTVDQLKASGWTESQIATLRTEDVPF